jgi:hypothetical protein
MSEKRRRLSTSIAALTGLLVLFSCIGGKESVKAVTEDKDNDVVAPVSSNTGQSLPYSSYWTYYSDEEDVLYHVYWQRMNDLSWLYDNKDILALELWHGEFTDLRPLATMKNLERLCLYNNAQLADISPLTEMANLKKLEIHGSRLIKNYVPVASLKNLASLSIGCDIRIDFDAAYVSSLVNLQGLDLGFLRGSITNISLLGNLVCLKKLRICREIIKDFGWIKTLQELEHLFLEESTVGDLSPLLSLPKLEFVSFYYSAVGDIMPLIESTSIKEIWGPKYGYDESLSEDEKYFYQVALSNKFYERGIGLIYPDDH